VLHPDRGWLGRVWSGAVLATIGYMVGGFIGTVVWLIFVDDSPEQGRATPQVERTGSA